MEGRRIPKKAKATSVLEVDDFIKSNLRSEFDLLDEIQKNCNSDVKKISKVLAKLDKDSSNAVNNLIDNLTLAIYSINNIKNNIAMNLYKREISLKQELKEFESTQTGLEGKEEELETKIKELENECLSLKDELSKAPEKPELDKGELKNFKKRETELKNKLRNKLKKWSKIRADLDSVVTEVGKGSKKALDEVDKTVTELESELAKTERALKAKSTKNKTNLTKKKQSLKQKITRVKKKYEVLQKERKSSSKNPEKVIELDVELAHIINSIDQLENEYNDILQFLDLQQDGLYEFFSEVPSITADEPSKSSEDLNKVLNQSLEREKKSQQQLDTALKNIDELKKEIENMDKDYYTDIKKEYERLYKKLETEKEKDYEKKLKNLGKDDILKIETKYKKLIKKQEDTHKKDLELAAQRVFELKQYISQLEQGQIKGVVVEPDLDEKVMVQTEMASVPTSTPGTNRANRKGLPLKLPKNHIDPGFQTKSPYGSNRGGIPIQPEPTVLEVNGDQTLKSKTKKQKKKKSVKTEEMAQCGACDEFIPMNSSVCPNCGAQFSDVEIELGSCGNCGNLIPVSAQKCPICGVKFK